MVLQMIQQINGNVSLERQSNSVHFPDTYYPNIANLYAQNSLLDKIRQ